MGGEVFVFYSYSFEFIGFIEFPFQSHAEFIQLDISVVGRLDLDGAGNCFLNINIVVRLEPSVFCKLYRFHQCLSAQIVEAVFIGMINHHPFAFGRINQ